MRGLPISARLQAICLACSFFTHTRTTVTGLPQLLNFSGAILSILLCWQITESARAFACLGQHWAKASMAIDVNFRLHARQNHTHTHGHATTFPRARRGPTMLDHICGSNAPAAELLRYADRAGHDLSRAVANDWDCRRHSIRCWKNGFLFDNAHTFFVASNTTYTHYASARRASSI